MDNVTNAWRNPIDIIAQNTNDVHGLHSTPFVQLSDKLLRQLAISKTASSMHDSRALQHKYFQMVEAKKKIILFFFVFSIFLFERHMRAKIKFFQHFFLLTDSRKRRRFFERNIVMVSN